MFTHTCVHYLRRVDHWEQGGIPQVLEWWLWVGVSITTNFSQWLAFIQPIFSCAWIETQVSIGNFDAESIEFGFRWNDLREWGCSVKTGTLFELSAVCLEICVQYGKISRRLIIASQSMVLTSNVSLSCVHLCTEITDTDVTRMVASTTTVVIARVTAKAAVGSWTVSPSKMMSICSVDF